MRTEDDVRKRLREYQSAIDARVKDTKHTKLETAIKVLIWVLGESEEIWIEGHNLIDSKNTDYTERHRFITKRHDYYAED